VGALFEATSPAPSSGLAAVMLKAQWDSSPVEHSMACRIVGSVLHCTVPTADLERAADVPAA